MQIIQGINPLAIPTNIMSSKMASKGVRLLEAKNAAAESSIRTSLFVDVEDMFSIRVPLEEAIYNVLTNWNFFDYMFEDGTLFSIRRNLPYYKFEGSVNIHINREYNSSIPVGLNTGGIFVFGEFNEGIAVCKKFLEVIKEHSANLKNQKSIVS